MPHLQIQSSGSSFMPTLTRVVRQSITFLAAAILAFSSASSLRADLIVTWADVGGDLNLSITGTWASWDSGTTLNSTDTLLFNDNGNTTFAFDLSRGNVNGVGQNVIMDINDGSGSVTAPDFVFGAPLPTIGYNITHLNEGGSLALEAEVPSMGTFTINESFNLGSSFTLAPGTRTFSSSTAPGDTLTMHYVSAVPEPSSLALLGFGSAALAWTRRRRVL